MRALLLPVAEFHNGVYDRQRRVFLSVSNAVAIRAQKAALLDFRCEPSIRAVELADREVFG